VGPFVCEEKIYMKCCQFNQVIFYRKKKFSSHEKNFCDEYCQKSKRKPNVKAGEKCLGIYNRLNRVDKIGLNNALSRPAQTLSNSLLSPGVLLLVIVFFPLAYWPNFSNCSTGFVERQPTILDVVLGKSPAESDTSSSVDLSSLAVFTVVHVCVRDEALAEFLSSASV